MEKRRSKMILPPHMMEELKTRSPRDWKSINEIKKEEKMVQALVTQIKPLYSHFLEEAKKQGISKRQALREAMFIWIEKTSKNEDLTRFQCLFRDFQEVISIVRDMLKATSIDELKQKIDYILNYYG
jgi:hypothetical protein